MALHEQTLNGNKITALMRLYLHTIYASYEDKTQIQKYSEKRWGYTHLFQGNMVPFSKVFDLLLWHLHRKSVSYGKQKWREIWYLVKLVISFFILLFHLSILLIQLLILLIHLVTLLIHLLSLIRGINDILTLAFKPDTLDRLGTGTVILLRFKSFRILSYE